MLYVSMYRYIDILCTVMLNLVRSMTPYFPKKTIQKMKRLSLSESKVLDVLNHGKAIILPSGSEALVKKYSNYEVGLFYTRNSKSGDYIITHVWKRERR